MKYLYLDLENSSTTFNYPEIIKHEVSTFKGGEEHIKILNGEDLHNHSVTISARAINSSTVMRILMANDALQRLGVKQISLSIWYLPYARQDRVMNSGEPLSIKVFANLINTCNFEKVHVLDPHSDVGPALINNVQIMHSFYYKFVSESFKDIAERNLDNLDICVVSPDSGAYKKIFKTCESIGFDGEVILCNKARNLQTNEIQSLTVVGDVKNKICVIIDDICDGGRTFAEIGAQLKEKGASMVYLIVTHGIFSYGEDQLVPHLDHIWTTNSFRDYESDLVTNITKNFNYGI